MRGIWNNFKKNLFLWSPLILAFGASVYFSLPYEPGFIFPLLFALLSGAISVMPRVHVLGRVISLFAFGMFYASAFTAHIATPQITHNMHDLTVTGTVQNIDYTTDKTRLYLYVPMRELQIDSEQNAIVRLTVPDDTASPTPGDKISATIGIYRPCGMDAPETFDYARWAYFNGITATGYIDSFNVIESAPVKDMNYIRNWLHMRANSFLTDSLVLGYKKSVPTDDSTVWTTAGIGHIWAISGFHTTLVGGWLFAIFYLLCRCIPYITRRVPARKVATICAWCGLLFYVLLSGGAVSTWRAFLMASLIFAALIIGRSAISLRNVSIVFIALFLFNPHYIVQAGFQLSFAAIYGLVWLWTVYNPKMPNNKILRGIWSVVLTTVVATMFTSVFIIANFYSFPIYGLLGNLILVPIFSFLIMPMVMIGTLFSVFGLNFLLSGAGYVYSVALQIAQWIANIPGANIAMPHISTLAIGLIIFGLAIIIFNLFNKHKVNYIIFSGCVILSVLTTLLSPRPVFYATDDHELVGFVYDGKLEFNKARASNHYFTFDTWKRINREIPSTQNIRRRPDKGVHIYKTDKFTIAYIQKFVPLSKNIVDFCRDENIDYIVSYFDIDSDSCNHKILRNGFVIYPRGTIRYVPHNRRWHNAPQ